MMRTPPAKSMGVAVGVESLRAAVGAGEGEAVVVGALERFAVQMCVEAGAAADDWGGGGFGGRAR